MKDWYSRDYLGKGFDRFLKSDMKLSDFITLQEELQRVLVQLQLSRSFTESGYPNKIGKIHIKPSEPKAMLF